MTGRKTRLSLRPGWTKHIIAVDCPQEEEHTLCPTGYLHWHEWAERKSKTHRTVRCAGCDRWAIWVPKNTA